MNSYMAQSLSYAGNLDLVLLGSLLQKSREWLALQQLKRQVYQERQQLMELPDELLKDIGITRIDAERESLRGFDDMPSKRVRKMKNELGG